MRDKQAKFTAYFFVFVMFFMLWPNTGLAGGINTQDNKLLSVDFSKTLDTQNWLEYESLHYGFRIKYPRDFEITKSPDLWGVSGQVVAFKPESFERYSGTDLASYSVVVGVEDFPSPETSLAESKPIYQNEVQTKQSFENSGLSFSKYYAFEGAAGSQYEKIAYRTMANGQRYEITLLIRTMSKGAVPGETEGFEPTGLIRIFETMVRTFALEGDS